MADGVLLFGRYAYPPNELGFGAPDEPEQGLERGSANASDEDLRQRAKAFEGAWPYLEIIAASAGIADPLDERVVEAYWVGNRLLDGVGPRLMGDSLESRFKKGASGCWDHLAESVPAGAVPHHSFHVFAVSPWLALLKDGNVDEPLRMLDHCRIRWGQVVDVEGEEALVRSRRLEWDGQSLTLGASSVERVLMGVDGLGRAGNLAPGDGCSLHWDWVCERLDEHRITALRDYTLRQLAVVNGLSRPASSSVRT
jgi:hypothetical protein